MSMPATTKTDLLLLGLLLDRPMHGYELYQQIQAEGIDGWFSVSAAGVYYSLGKLRDGGWVTETRQRGGHTSRKSIYRLTDEGRSGFFAAMEQHLAGQEEIHLDYDLMVYLMNRVPLRRAVPCLERHRAFLDAQVQQVQADIAEERDDGHSPLKLTILDHKRRYLDMERDWLAEVIDCIRDNGDAPGVQAGQRRGLMVLSGNLRDYHLPDLLRLILSGQHTGTLTVTDGAQVRTLVFREGQPVCGAYQVRDVPPVGTASCEEVMEGLCELFRWQQGEFTFDQKADCEEVGVPLQCSTEELILKGCRKVDNWATIQRLVPSADTIFEPGPAVQRLGALDLTPTEGQVMAAADGLKDVATIARELDLTLFDTSRVFYCLTAIGLLRTADPDKIRLRRVFREIAELMCKSTLAWRASPDDRTCEEEVNNRCKHLPIQLQNGRIVDRADPQMAIDQLKEMYRFFLQRQFEIIGRFFGHANASEAFERTLRQLSPELQDVAKRSGFHRIASS